MAGRSKKPKNPEIQHLSELTFSELASVAWDFLVTETGQQETALQLPPKKLRDYAGDFLDSEEGRFYWPLSDLQQWPYEASHADVKKWISELMIRERKRKEAELSTITVDDQQQGSDSKKEKGKGPTEGPNAPHRRKSSSRPRSRPEESVLTAKAAKASPEKDPVIPPRRAKSPTIAPDVPYEELSQTPLSASKKRIRPTPAAVRIAGEKLKSPEKPDGSDSITRSESRSTTLGLGLSKSPTTPRKRPADTESVADSSASSVASPSDRRNKRIALSPSAPIREASSPQAPFLEAGDPSAITTSPSGPIMPLPKRERESSFTQTDEKQPGPHPTVVAAYGLQYSVDNLGKVPERVLGYVAECIHHQIRLANRTETSSQKDEYRSRSTLLQKMHADLESRIKFLAEDAEKKRWVESSHCLWEK